MKNKLIVLLSVIMLVIIPQTGCGGKEPVWRSSFYFDTPCTITIYDQKTEKAGQLITDAFSLCQDYERTLSSTIAGSDIYRINQAAGQSTKVSELTVDILEKGLYYGELSEGAFDITVGRLSDLWKYKEEDDPTVPALSDIDEALDTVDYRKVSIQGDNRVTLLDPQAKLDLGGVAKGYIADLIADYLKEQGVEKAIINLGGNVAVIGEKQESTPWSVGIEKPYSNRREIVGKVDLKDQTVVTAGIYERFFQENGTIYHHILDTSTGYPADTDLDAVTIVGPLGASGDCDVLSTICLMMGSEKGKSLIESIEGLEAAFMKKDGSVTVTHGMPFTPA